MHCVDLYSTTVARSSFQHGLLYVAICRFGSNELCPRRRQRQDSDDTTLASITCKDSRGTFDILAPSFYSLVPSQAAWVLTVYQRAHRRGKCQHTMFVCPLLNPFSGYTRPENQSVIASRDVHEPCNDLFGLFLGKILQVIIAHHQSSIGLGLQGS